MAMALEQARMNVRWASGLDMVTGIWLLVAPFVLGYASVGSALWNSVIAGVAVALLAASRETREGVRQAAPSWINAAVGVWLLIAPFALGFSGVTEAFWNHMVVGVAVIAFALWSALSTPRVEA